MATKAKAKAKVITTKKAAAVDYKKVIADLKKGELPKTAGLLVRARILEAKLTPEQMVSEVKKHFKGSTMKIGDVYWNRGKLKMDGIKVPAVVRTDE